MARCPSCGTENREGARFCDGCGHELATPTPADEVRKTVTIVFCDVTGSTELGERLDPEALRRVMRRYFETMTAAIERHGGRVEKFIGDAVMAVFGIPETHEDDALRAVRAAADMREGLRTLNKELERDHGATVTCRIGVHTGEVVAGDRTARQAIVTGDAVNVAARLEQAAPPGEVLISEPTLRLVRDATEAEAVPPLELKGKAEPVAAFRLLGVTPGAPGAARRFETPLVGRERPLQQIRHAFDEVVADRACHLFTVLGPPGVGKSRLVLEALRGLRDRASIGTGRCLSYGEGITYWPIAEVVRELLDDPHTDPGPGIERLLAEDPAARDIAARVAAVIGTDTELAFPADEVGWALRRLFEGVARARPLVVVIDDLHWAEPALLELIDQVSDWSRDAPILLLCMARPELLEARPDWGGGKLRSTTIALESLSHDDAARLIALLLDGDVPPTTVQPILAATEGNPLFIEETVAMLVEEGALHRAEGGWQGTPEGFAVPPTIQAVLEARLDLLDADDRALLGRASVVGQVFYRDALGSLDDGGPPDGAVDAGLRRLLRRDLVRPVESDIPGHDAFRFRHGLLRDASYAMLPKETRAALHERLADWLQRQDVPEVQEFAGYHLEAAHGYVVELGPEDDHARALAERAADLLSDAARHARARDDLPAVLNLGRRAAALRRADDPRRARDLIDVGWAQYFDDAFAEALETFRVAVEVAGAAGDERALAAARLGHANTERILRPEGTAATEAMVRDLLPRLEAWEDDRGLALAYYSRCELLWNACRFAEASADARRGREHAAAAGDRILERVLSMMQNAAIFLGPGTAEDLRASFGELERRTPLLPSLRPYLFLMQAITEAMDGDADAARALWQAGYEGFEEMFGRAGPEVFMARMHVELLVGDDEQALEAVRRQYELMTEMGDLAHRSTSAMEWAALAYRVGDYAAADEKVRDCLATTADDDVINQVGWRGVRAKLLAREGRFEEAEALAREALEWVARSDMLLERAWAHEDLAEVLVLAGRVDEAREAQSLAVEAAARKGAVALADRLRARLTELGRA